jgi:hypothetical protein
MPTKAKSLNLADHYQSSEELTTGKWVTLDCGLEAWVCRAASPLFQKALAAQHRKYGLDKKTRRIDSEKHVKALIGAMARSTFRGFRHPEGIDIEINGQLVEDTVKDREWILTEFPDLREELTLEAEALADEFNDEAEEVGKG